MPSEDSGQYAHSHNKNTDSSFWLIRTRFWSRINSSTSKECKCLKVFGGHFSYLIIKKKYFVCSHLNRFVEYTHHNSFERSSKTHP